MFIRLLWATAVLTVFFTSASAGALDGNALHEECGKQRPTFCMGFVLGVVSVMDKHSGMVSPGAQLCIPNGATGTQVMDVVRNYLTYHPQHRASPAAYLTAVALLDAWPCRD